MKKIDVKEMVILSVCAAVIFSLKITLAVLPNIELVSFFLILFTLLWGRKTLYTAFLYVFMEICFYGIGFWTVGYVFLWPGLVLVTNLVRNILKENFVLCALLSGLFGFCFDMLYAVIIGIFSGVKAGAAYFFSGIMFSVVHMVSNYLIMILIGKRIYVLLEKCLNQYKLKE